MHAEQTLWRRGMRWNPFLAIRHRFRRVYACFQPSCVYWTLIQLALKGVIILLGFLFVDDALFSAVAAAITLLMALQLHQVAR